MREVDSPKAKTKGEITQHDTGVADLYPQPASYKSKSPPTANYQLLLAFFVPIPYNRFIALYYIM